MVPVDHVARCVVACSLYPTSNSAVTVGQITAHPRMTFTEFAATLKMYGYDISILPYKEWKERLVRYVEQQQQQQQQGIQNKKEEHALMPLYHFVTGSSSLLFVLCFDLITPVDFL